jgi:hypothetical protein
MEPVVSAKTSRASVSPAVQSRATAQESMPKEPHRLPWTKIGITNVDLFFVCSSIARTAPWLVASWLITGLPWSRGSRHAAIISAS